MKTTPDIYCAVRLDGELDVIAFESLADCTLFCEKVPDYQLLHTGLYTASEALELFEWYDTP